MLFSFNENFFSLEQHPMTARAPGGRSVDVNLARAIDA